MRLRQVLNIVLAFGFAIIAGLLARDVNRGNCSEAVLNNLLAGGTVQFAPDCVLPLSEPKIITGNVRISGGTVLGDSTFPLFIVSEGATLVLESITIKRGNPAIQNEGVVHIRNSKLQDNKQGVINRGTVTIIHTDILDTSCIACHGAALFNEHHAVIENSRISRASALPDPARQGAPAGGAIFNRGTLTILDSEISRARAGVGGAIFNLGTIQITRSTLRNNEIYTLSQGTGHGGAIDNHGNLTILDSRIERNTTYNMGGGINNHNELRIRNSIIAANRCTSRSCTGVNVFNYAETGTVDLINNYWGSNQNPADTLYGVPPEAYIPYLTNVPEWAE